MAIKMRGALLGSALARWSIGPELYRRCSIQFGFLVSYEILSLPTSHVDFNRAVKILKEGKKFHFFNVTTPFKEMIVPFLDENQATSIGSINTIVVHEDRWIGHNFDGVACWNAIEAQCGIVSGKNVLIIGVGGAARAAIDEAKKRGLSVFIKNRTVRKAQLLAQEMKVNYVIDVPSSIYFDIFIQATPLGMKGMEQIMPVQPEILHKNAIVMEMVYIPEKTPFVRAALQKGCRIVWGKKMFAEVSYKQLLLYFSHCSKNDIERAIVHMEVSLCLQGVKDRNEEE